MITLDDLTPTQAVWADVLWACDTQHEIDRFIQGLPTPVWQREARTVLELMRLAVLDQQI